MPRLPDLGVVLVLDDEKGQLGGVALELVRCGLDALYSNDPYEGALLARQEGRRVGGVLLNADAPPGRVDEVIDTVCPETGLDPEAIAVLGDRPADPILRAHLERGLRWCLWKPFEADRLRFIGGLTLWEGNDASVRLDLRVPTRIPATLTCRGHSQRAIAVNLSRGGARLEVATRLPPGRRVQLELGSGDTRIVCSAIVRWTTAFRSAKEPVPPGMGLEFENPSVTTRAALMRLLEAALDRFRIRLD